MRELPHRASRLGEPAGHPGVKDRESHRPSCTRRKPGAERQRLTEGCISRIPERVHVAFPLGAVGGAGVVGGAAVAGAAARGAPAAGNTDHSSPNCAKNSGPSPRNVTSIGSVTTDPT